MSKRVFFQNAAIMTVTSLLLRLIGIVFRIYISNRVGAEGMGLYQLIISVYVLASSFATAGLCTAVTRLCADELVCGTARSVKRIVTVSILASVIVGVISAVAIILGADAVATVFIGDIRAVPSLKILTISLPFMGISSCIKGYFYARRRVASSSFAQILEQIVRIGAIVLILEMQKTVTVENACFAILSGDTIAEGVSCLFMTICYIVDKKRVTDAAAHGSTTAVILRQTLHIATPITAGRYLNSGLRTAENMMVPHALDRYTLSRSVSLSQFGKLKGMAMPLLFFPSSFLTAFTTLLIPEISQAKALSQHRRLNNTIGRAFQMTLLSSFLIGGVFWALAYPLGNLIYHDEEVGYMIRVLAPLTPIMYLESVVVGILKGLDQQGHSLVYSVLDSVSRILLIIAAIPRFGMNGFLGVMVFSNILTCFLNVRRLCRVTQFHIPCGKWVIYPLIAVTVAVSVAGILPTPPGDLIAECIVRGGMIGGVYLCLLPFFKCISKEDLIAVKPIRKKKTDLR